ncbi:PrpF domain-containing protein [Cloacibacillus sp.]|uniref:2-methylaconitate cis-trans isomerase PrpF family protein n=1 Tax=Cloacibacillus sp. TaxID=2049023 RepID=UPI0025C35270|nr:PrpF domain-containing protein [Cloacibacillus sp.]MCC8057834.1 PrpF protein [Cloacibacillus sp.]
MKPNTKIPCVFMRGGTSKALFFHEKDLPEDESLRDKIILSALGSPDVRQIDGMGGGTTTTSKVAIIKKSSREGVDIDYTFRQVSPESSIVGKTMNCGNISSAVGPFAIDEGLVEAVEPVTSVRVFNTNTNKLMVLHVPVGNGRALTEGNFEIDGVPGTGAKIQIEFSNPQGAVSGRLLPTGSPLDTIVIDGKAYEYSLLDVGNPTVFVRAEQFGLSGLELPAEFEALPNSGEICRLLEIIRGTCAISLGLASDLEDAAVNSQTLPKISLCTTSKDYTAGDGRLIKKESVDYVGRMFSLGMKMIQAHMALPGICALVAANLPGSVINRLLHEGSCGGTKFESLRIGHPFGIMEVDGRLAENAEGGYDVTCGMIGRTARCLMEGFVYVREG